MMLLLSRANKIMKKMGISEGGISGTVVDPKKIWTFALENQACNISWGITIPPAQ